MKNVHTPEGTYSITPEGFRALMRYRMDDEREDSVSEWYIYFDTYEEFEAAAREVLAIHGTLN